MLSFSHQQNKEKPKSASFSLLPFSTPEREREKESREKHVNPNPNPNACSDLSLSNLRYFRGSIDLLFLLSFLKAHPLLLYRDFFFRSIEFEFEFHLVFLRLGFVVPCLLCSSCSDSVIPFSIHFSF